jgi:hypothetical protein
VKSTIQPPATPPNEGTPANLSVKSAPAAPLSNAPGKTSFNALTSTPVSYGSDFTVFHNADGSETKKVSPTAINFQRSDGSWVPAGTSIVSDSVAGDFTVADNPLSPTFGATSAGGAGFAVNDGSSRVSVTLEGADTVQAVRPAASALHSAQEGLGPAALASKSSALEYPNVFPGEDLQYQVAASEVKETLVLNSVPAASQTSWVWAVHAPGLTMSESKLSSLYLTDANGVVRYNIPNPVMWDSSGVAGQSESVMVNAPFSFAQDAAGDWQITVIPDAGWLDDPSRVYPVVIDPTLATGPSTDVSYENTGTVYSGQGRMGNSRAGGDTEWRTVLCYPYSTLVQGSEITPGSVLGTLYQAGTANNEPAWLDIATAFSFNGAGPTLTIWYNSTGNSQTSISDNSLSNEFQAVDNANFTSQCLMIAGNEVPGSYTYKQVNTAIYLNYQAAPAITVNSPASGSTVGMMPVLSVTPSYGTYYAQPGPSNYGFEVSTNPNPDVSAVWSTQGYATSSPFIQVPHGTLTPGVTYYWKAFIEDGFGATRALQPVGGSYPSFVADAPGTVPQAGSVPGDQSVLTSLTPTLSIPSGSTSAGTLSYQFRLTTGADGVSGQVASSTWEPASGSAAPAAWQVPAGVLQDGGAYTWTVLVQDAYGTYWTWVNHFTVNLRITNPGPSATDSAGPVTVNLANGNVSTSFTSPTVSTVGGPMGLSFTYNSQADSNGGLIGSYYNAEPAGATSPNFTFPPATAAVLQRTDTQLAFSWGTSGPGGTGSPASLAFPTQNYLVQWTGYITPPAAGNYTFGFIASDTAKLFLGGSSTPTVNQTTATSLTTPVMGTAVALPAGPTLITVQYTDATDTSALDLEVNYTGLAGGPIPVPASWLSHTVPLLPSGWSSSAPILGDAGEYVSAQINNGSVVLTDVTGATHTYSAVPNGSGYTPPPGENGVVSFASGVLTFTDDAGTVYTFNAQGQVTSVTAPADGLKPASPVVSYRTVSGAQSEVSSLSDPLSASGSTYSRQVVFAYAGDTAASVGLSASDTDATGAACPVLTGFSAPPPGMICRIIYPGHVAGNPDTTELEYDSNGQLARIINPRGTADPVDSTSTSFTYIQDSTGNWLLHTITTPTANVWIDRNAAGSAPTVTQQTTINYDATDRASSVLLPSPDGTSGTSQPTKNYFYSNTSTNCVPVPGSTSTSCVDVVGLNPGAPATWHARTVGFDTALRTISDQDAMGLISTRTWDSSDDLLTSVSPQGEETTTVYDTLHRPTDTYGPAPASCFGTGQVPIGFGTTACTVAGGTLAVRTRAPPTTAPRRYRG